jgi:chemotaxis signal transduction protein
MPRVYHGGVTSLPSERKALLVSVGGVRLAARLSQIREIIETAGADGGEVLARGEPIPSAFLASVLGLPPHPARFALVTETSPRLALRVEALHGIVDVKADEAYQLPVHTVVPQPSPYAGALVVDGLVALELAVASIGFAPIEPALDLGAPPPSLGPWLEREIRFARGGLTFGVPLSILVQVVEDPRLAPVPLSPPSHRGLLFHGRALHAVLDVGVRYGVPPEPEPRRVLILDAGGAAVGVLADRVLGPGEGQGGEEVLRPPWDALFGGG